MTAMQTEQEKWEILPLPRGIKHHNHVGYIIDQTYSGELCIDGNLYMGRSILSPK